MYVFMGDFSTNFRHQKKKLFCAFVYVSFGLKKPGDFTVPEGHCPSGRPPWVVCWGAFSGYV